MIICPLISGSSGNATYVASGETRILVDCGGSGVQIEKAMRSIGADPSRLDAILVTHSHTDHIKGLGVLARRYRVPLHASVGTWEEIQRRNKIGVVPGKQLKIFQTGAAREIRFESIVVKAFSTPHDADDSVGYVFSDGQTSFGLATDIGSVTRDIRAALLGCDYVLLEANYDEKMLWEGPYPYPLKKRIAGPKGHLSNAEAAKFAVELLKNGAQTILLGHLSEHNNTPSIAYKTVSAAISKAGLDITRQPVYMTRRHEPSRLLKTEAPKKLTTEAPEKPREVRQKVFFPFGRRRCELKTSDA
ncbi:MAG: MBL fold metallo-hydrolase [Thermoguttaceae bacterium]|jgi:phosphoribosyl 1,2-cyclic phosphodiesterase